MRDGILAPPARLSAVFLRIHEWLTVEDFTVHDWHDQWAPHRAMAGIDLVTIIEHAAGNRCGWSSAIPASAWI